MIQLKIQTDFGEILVSGEDVSTLKGNVSQLENSAELYASLGRIKAKANETGVTSSAIANAGNILGAQVVEVESGPPQVFGADALRGTFSNPETGKTQDAWYDPRPHANQAKYVTNDPNDDNLTVRENGEFARFWQWIQE